MGFQASEAVETLSYDFNPFVDAAGDIPEPTVSQVNQFRQAMVTSVEALGLKPEDIQSGKVSVADMGALMDKAGKVEESMLGAIADLTGIPDQTLKRLPYRVQSAFAGYIVGMFLRPEA